MIIGTAGHIDHGKTSLIKRLTGRDTDRLPEEIKRGISIELGYAYVPLEDAAAETGNEVLGFVDVPGHERFVHTMLAGATGIDFALLVVAVDDGVMPQTDEHLDILLTLGVAKGAIALTKIDVAAPGGIDAVRAELAARVRATPAADWPLFPVSSLGGEGIGALDAHLRAAARDHRLRAAAGHFRLAIDRCFTLAGAGTIVTGTVSHGTVRVGDSVVVAPTPHGALKARVRSIHAQDRPSALGRAGQRCALNLVGLEKEQIERGMAVQAEALANVVDRLDASLRLSAREARALVATHVHFHCGAADVMARLAVLDRTRIEPGEEALVSLGLDRPLTVCQGDRFVIRDGAAQRTLGGGVVLDTYPVGSPTRRGRRAPPRLAFLATLRDRPRSEALASWLALQPIALARLCAVWNLREDELPTLLAAAETRVAAGTVFARDQWLALGESALAAIAHVHQNEPELPGFEQNRLARMVAPGIDREAFAGVLDELLSEKRLVRRGVFLALPTHSAELGRDQRSRWERIKPLLLDRKFDPPRVRDIARGTGIPETETRALLKSVMRIGDVMQVAHDHYFLTTAVGELADIAADVAATHGAARAADFRDRIGTGRKLAIQVLEFFDRAGYTHRAGDDHLIRRANPWHV
jgi:selenocysteine-specific elongation factor